MTATGAETPMRSDARRTRDRLLDAAAELLESTGRHFTLPDLARRAGVGTATAYRHFDDVADALAAVEVRSIQALTAAIDAIPAASGARRRYDDICALWVGRSTRESAAARFLRSPEGVLQRADRGDPSITALVGALSVAVDDLVAAGEAPAQDTAAAVLIWITLFDERTVIDLARTHGWTTHRITDYLGAAVLGALRNQT
ncbi:AcrR family transcriptional regulator [Nakamurella sp. UYEF19]|uniref:TetR/AcrR family transcriptional regulator n=1 Tax=Nakamurella sp. UYEF19 TaxID=1756392 RepID=UPI0033973FFA